MPDDSKHTQTSLSPISADWLRLRVALSPRFRDLAIFVVTTDRQTDYFTPAHARGVMIIIHICTHTTPLEFIAIALVYTVNYSNVSLL